MMLYLGMDLLLPIVLGSLNPETYILQFGKFS